MLTGRIVICRNSGFCKGILFSSSASFFVLSVKSLRIIVLVLGVTLLATGSPVVSQAYTTIMATSLVTKSVYSTENMGVTTQTSTVTNVFLNLTATATGIPPLYCYYGNAELEVQAGTLAVTGTIGPASIIKVPGSVTPIDFYIMTKAQFNTFRSAGCLMSYDGILKVRSIMSTYVLNWDNPPVGVYEIVVYDELPKIDFTVPITINIQSTMEQTSTVYLLVTGEETLQAPVTYTTTIQAGPILSSGSFPIAEFAIVTILVLMAAAIIRYRVKLGSNRKAHEQMTKPYVKSRSSRLNPRDLTRHSENWSA